MQEDTSTSTSVNLTVNKPLNGSADMVEIFDAFDRNVSNQKCNNKDGNFACSVTRLNVGDCYSWSTRSILNKRYSENVTKQHGLICTCELTITVKFVVIFKPSRDHRN